MSIEQQTNVYFELAHDVYLLKSTWDLLTISQQTSVDIGKLQSAPTTEYYFAITRSGFKVIVERIEQSLYETAQFIKSGYTLDEMAQTSESCLMPFPQLLERGWLHDFYK